MTSSQNDEDLILGRLCQEEGIEKGVYVDIGAHHPIRFSNTYKLHQQGWSGINIDPLPHVMKLFDDERPTDINLNVGVSDVAGSLSYWMFEEPAYNTMNEVRANQVIERKYSPLKVIVKVPVRSLQSIFEEFLNENQRIDVMDIDVEDYEIHVLKSNDWDKYRPRIVLVECYVDGTRDMKQVYNDEAVCYLLEKHYRVVAKVFNAVFLMDNLAD